MYGVSPVPVPNPCHGFRSPSNETIFSILIITVVIKLLHSNKLESFPKDVALVKILANQRLIEIFECWHVSCYTTIDRRNKTNKRK